MKPTHLAELRSGAVVARETSRVDHALEPVHAKFGEVHLVVCMRARVEAQAGHGHDGDAQGATRRQRRFPTGAWMTYKATITQLLRQSITHLIRTLQYMYIAADETLDDLQLPI